MAGQFEYEFLRKDGTRIYTSISASQITDDDGKLVGTLALIADDNTNGRQKGRIISSKTHQKSKFVATSIKATDYAFLLAKRSLTYLSHTN